MKLHLQMLYPGWRQRSSYSNFHYFLTYSSDFVYTKFLLVWSLVMFCAICFFKFELLYFGKHTIHVILVDSAFLNPILWKQLKAWKKTRRDTGAVLLISKHRTHLFCWCFWRQDILTILNQLKASIIKAFSTEMKSHRNSFSMNDLNKIYESWISDNLRGTAN